MPPLPWIAERTELIQQFETRHQSPDSAALLSWAAWAVDSLHYLDDIDLAYDTSPETIGDHDPAVVDVAHARWATTTSITAVDLCAAALGRAFCQHENEKELDLEDLKPLRAQLPSLARRWVEDVCAASQYKTIKEARNWLTHSRVPRHFAVNLGAGGPPQRLQLELPTTTVGVRQLIEDARDFATQHVSALLEMLPRL